jgi:hypothetical protein
LGKKNTIKPMLISIIKNLTLRAYLRNKAFWREEDSFAIYLINHSKII